MVQRVQMGLICIVRLSSCVHVGKAYFYLWTPSSCTICLIALGTAVSISCSKYRFDSFSFSAHMRTGELLLPALYGSPRRLNPPPPAVCPGAGGAGDGQRGLARRQGGGAGGRGREATVQDGTQAAAKVQGEEAVVVAARLLPAGEPGEKLFGNAADFPQNLFAISIYRSTAASGSVRRLARARPTAPPG